MCRLHISRGLTDMHGLHSRVLMFCMRNTLGYTGKVCIVYATRTGLLNLTELTGMLSVTIIHG